MPQELKDPLQQVQDDELVATRRRQIFLAVTRVLARKSFHQASVKEIAAEAGIAAGSIYVYLQSKDEILLLIAESMVAELVDELPRIRREADDDPRQELLGVMRAALDIIDRYREAFAVLNHEVRYLERNPRYRPIIKQVLHPYKEALARPLERGRTLDLIKFVSIPSATEILHMLLSGWAMGGDDFLAHTDKLAYWREIEGIIEGRLFAPLSDAGA
ncbi:MAG TPA: TetR/AcrR family transcriptional regulator [Candidatus Binataceae bacterium]|nr:TetR/AcrR family transcriptional regulator [Candidatus Binataceae bacterium]